MDNKIGRFFDKIIQKGSDWAKEDCGERRLRDNEFEIKEHFWQEIKQKHGFEESDIKNESNYFIETLLNYLELQDKTEDLFGEMVAEKKANGETENYREIKARWGEAKEKLNDFRLSDEKLPDEINPTREGQFSPEDFIRKYNLGKLKRNHRNLLLDFLSNEKHQREKNKDIKEKEKKTEEELSTV